MKTSFTTQPRFPWRRRLGLGDAVASIARPIAGVVDAIAGTNVKRCAGCRRRRLGLNRALPNINPLA